jgi:hypothetical protein
MMTANNGILIVALTMAYGLHAQDKWLIASAFALAGLSYVVNVLDEWKVTTGRNAIGWLTLALGALTYAYLAAKVFA